MKGGKEGRRIICSTCGSNNRLKNNRAVAEKYRRLRDLRKVDPIAPGCRTAGCFAEGMLLDEHPEFYRRFGRTASGDARHQCKLCRATFSVGPPARRHKRGDKNSLVLKMLVNGVPLSKIAVITGLSCNDIHRKIDFIHDQVRGFVARREDLSRVDRRAVGSRFATGSQSLTLNWPTRRQRTPVVVQHLATAHARSGFVMEAALQFDPAVSMDEIEKRMAAAGEHALLRCFRQQGRVWSKTEFEGCLRKQRARRLIQKTDLYRLPHTGALVRSDILQFAHGTRLREMLADHAGTMMFVLDGDPALRAAFHATFAQAIRMGRVEIAAVLFDKGMSNDKRNQAVADGRQLLADQSGLTLAQLRDLSDEDFADLQDTHFAPVVARQGPRHSFAWPYHTKSEPNRRVELPTRPNGGDPKKAARLVRLAALRSVDACFHKVREPTCASRLDQARRRAGAIASGTDRYYLHKPETMAKLIEICRFTHSWMGDGKSETPATRLGLAKGRIYDRDFM